MLVRIVLIAALIGAGMVFAKEQRFFERAGLVGYCQVVQAPHGEEGEWQGCHEGLMTGFPSLMQNSCTIESRSAGMEFWRCSQTLAPDRP